MVSKLLHSAQLEQSHLESIVIAGNTVMHHLFCDIDVTPMARTPFEPLDADLRSFRSRELGWLLAGNPDVHFLPCLGSFVGSDILCGVLATKMHQSETPIILIDLGTNGEIVVGNRERMLCASTAAGPAFEGGRIARGMRATTGAISEVWAEEGHLRCRVVGDVTPRGICGSGLVDAVAVGLDLGLVEPNGRLAVGSPALELVPTVTVTQNDIRQLQLAKAAIAAGIKILRRRFGHDVCREAPIYLAGAFGNYVNRISARRIGLVDVSEDKIEPAGNTALLGAKLVLFGHPECHRLGEVRSRIEHIALAADPAFHDIFIEETIFPG